MLKFQNTILEMVARGETLERTALRVCEAVEQLLPGVLCSVLTVDRDGRLHPLASPGLPRAYTAQVEGAASGPEAGSCGTAAHFRAPVAVHDIATDIRWQGYCDLLLPLGLKACWSSPILGADDRAIGTFAFYYREARGPTPYEEQIVQQCVHLCAIAIERHERLLDHQRRAFTDAMTALPNRAAYNAALAELDCSVPGTWALLVLDLDNLKVVNDTFGHHAGDCLLQIAADRLVLAAPDRTFRIGGDEFAMIVQSAEALGDLDRMVDDLLSRLALPADCGGHVVVPRATAGGAVHAAGGDAAERTRQNADFALYHAKETGRGGFVRYWPGIGTTITRRLEAIRMVDVALREGRIAAFYQPIFRLDTREIVGVEALCRIRVGDTVTEASHFHEATKDVHISTALTTRMVELVAADVRRWLDLGIPFQHVGINVSSADLYGGGLERILTGAFGRHGVPLKHIVLEVTETVYLGDGDGMVREAIEDLRGKGLLVALDDFGTGYASLTHLLSVPIDIVKIDKAFVATLAPDSPSKAIVEGMIHIAGKLAIRLVAEGVETEQQAAQLQAIGCVLGQGYLVSGALDPAGTTAMLLDRAQYLPSRRDPPAPPWALTG